MMRQTLLAALLAVFLRAGAKNSESWCECQESVIVCKGADQLPSSLESMRDCPAKKLRLKKSELAELPGGVLRAGSSTVQRLSIQQSVLYFLYDPFKDGSPFAGGKLFDFDVEKVRYLYNWNWTLLTSLTDLRRLYIKKCDFVYVGKTFANFRSSSMRELTIDNSGVRWIHDKAFAGLTNIAHFRMRRNEIADFRRDFLPNPALHLTVIDLQSNKLRSIGADLFAAMPVLQSVDLRHNELHALPELALPSATRELRVDLKGNPLICDCGLAWLEKYPWVFDTHSLGCHDSGTRHARKWPTGCSREAN